MEAYAGVKANEPSTVTPPRHGRWPGGVARWTLALALGLSQVRTVAAQESFAELVEAGDLAWRQKQFPAARSAYQKAMELDSVGSSRAVYRVAVLHSWDGDLVRAIPLFALYARLEPRDEEGRIALAKAYAWQGTTATAVAIYDSILGRDRTYRDAALGAAQALAWAGRFDDAIGRYSRWIADNGQDAEAALGRARTMAWAGRLKAAEREYHRLSEGGERLEANKGAALVAAWRGDLFRSEGMWRSITTRYPKDAEAWVGLAQVLRWSGRPEDARHALDRALLVDPENADAREQRRWVNADLAPAVTPYVGGMRDSDGNQNTVLLLRGSMRPLRRTVVTVTGSHRRASFDAAAGVSDAGRASIRWTPERRLTLSGDLGVVHVDAERGAVQVNRSRTVGGGAATVRLTSSASLGVGVAKDVFDETAPPMVLGIEVATVTVEGEIQLGRGMSLSAGGHRAELSGGSGDNTREAAFGALRWRPRRIWSLTLGGRSLGYQFSPRDGYFSPSRYRHLEVAGRWFPGRDLGWAGFVEAGLGTQYVRFAGAGDTKPTERIGLGLSYRPAPGTELEASFGFSNVSSSGNLASSKGSVYHASVFGLSARIRL